MFTRTLPTMFVTVAVIAAAAACQGTSTPTATTTPSVEASSTAPSGTASASAIPTSAAPTRAALSKQPCDLLTPAVAKKYVGDDAQRQLTYDSDPPVPVGDDACYYKGSTREVSVEIYPRPTDPTAPVNHFHVIQPQNQVDALSYEAYWFGPAESIVAVKDGLLISVKVANSEGGWTDQDRADDIELANLVVPQVG
jgi:hypothetical protein